jgi:hypothetical protein
MATLECVSRFDTPHSGSAAATGLAWYGPRIDVIIGELVTAGVRSACGTCSSMATDHPVQERIERIPVVDEVDHDRQGDDDHEEIYGVFCNFSSFGHVTGI